MNIRSVIESARADWGVLNRSELQKLAGDESLAADLCREVNLLTSDKFRTLSSWFTKPANLAPSAPVSLLMQAVIEEVKEHVPDYEPQIHRDGLTDVVIIGVTYHHLYDFLYVVIFNAAKHGNRTGMLQQRIELDDSSRLELALRVSIGSDIPNAEELKDVYTAYQRALADNSEDAMVVEGGSGLGKLVRIARDAREVEEITCAIDTGILTFTCTLVLERT